MNKYILNYGDIRGDFYIVKTYANKEKFEEYVRRTKVVAQHEEEYSDIEILEALLNKDGFDLEFEHYEMFDLGDKEKV